MERLFASEDQGQLNQDRADVEAMCAFVNQVGGPGTQTGQDVIKAMRNMLNGGYTADQLKVGGPLRRDYEA